MYLCEFIVPHIKFYYVKMGTITMIIRMLDPDQICGVDGAQTVSLRQRCTRASIRFGNVAGELLCTWHTALIDNGIWVLNTWHGDEETLTSFVPFKDAPWMPETSEDLGQVSYDKEGHVLRNEQHLNLRRAVLGVNTEGVVLIIRPRKCLPTMISLVQSRQ